MLDFFRNIGLGVILFLSKAFPAITPISSGLVFGLLDEWIQFLKDTSDIVTSSILFLFGKKTKEELSTAVKKPDWALWLPIFIGGIITTISLLTVAHSLFEEVPQYRMYAISFGFILSAGFIPWKELGSLKQWYHPAITVLSFITFLYVFNEKSFVALIPSAATYAIGGLLTPLTLIFPGMKLSFFLQKFGLFGITGVASIRLYVYILVAIAGFIGAIAVFQVARPLLSRFRPIFLAFYSGVTWASLALVWPFFNIKTGAFLLPWEVRLPIFTEQLLVISLSFGIVSIIRVVLEQSLKMGKSFGDPERMRINS